MDSTDASAPNGGSPEQPRFVDRVRVDDLAGFDGRIEVELARRGGLTFVVGANNSGKSRLASAITSADGPGLTYFFKTGQIPILVSFHSTGEFCSGVAISRGESGDVARTIDSDGSDLRVLPRGQDLPGRARYARKTPEVDSLSTRRHSFSLPTERAAKLEALSVDATSTLAPTGDNLANVLLWLQTRPNDAWARVRESVEFVVPEMGKVLAKVQGDTVEAVVALPGGSDRSLSAMGSGVAQVLMVALACETQPPGAFVVLDEPEIGLHPGAQRRLVDQLRKWADRSQIIVVTHSPFIISERREEDRLHWVRASDRNSTVELVDGDLAGLLDDLGVDALRFLEARRVLVVEGKTEMAVLPVLFPQLTKAGVTLFDAQGGSKVVNTRELLKRARVARRDAWALLDADETSFLHAGTGDDSGIHVLQCRELENILLEFPEAIAQVLQDDVNEQRIRRIADEFKEEKQALVFRSHVRESLKPAIDDLRLHDLGRDRECKTRVAKVVAEAHKSLGAFAAEAEVFWDQAVAEVDGRWEQDWLSLVVGSSVLTKLWDVTSQGYGGKPGKARDIAAEIRRLLDGRSLPKTPRPAFDALAAFVDKVVGETLPLSGGVERPG